jgi:type IV pilus assembly protein PilO
VSIWQRALVEKRRILLPLLIAIIADVVLFAVVVFPLGRQVASAEQEERAAREQLVRARQDYNTAKATVTGKQQADVALKKFYQDVLPSDESVAQRLTYTRLAQLAKQANVKLEHGTNEVTREKGSVLSKLTTRYTLVGDYRDVRRFIYSLETTPEFIVLENIALSSNTDQQSRGVAMNLDIATYFRSGNAAN